MKDLKYFEQLARRAYYRPVAVVTFELAVTMCAEAMQYARSGGAIDMVLNTLGLTGFASPDVFARYEMVNKWVLSAGTSMSVAMVCRPELIDPQKISVLMAQNRGATAEVFTNEAAAIVWLDSRPGAAVPNP